MIERYSVDGLSSDDLAALVGIPPLWMKRMMSKGGIPKKRNCEGVDPLDFLNALESNGLALLNVFSPSEKYWSGINLSYRSIIIDIRRDLEKRVICLSDLYFVLGNSKWWDMKSLGKPVFDLVPIDVKSGQWFSKNVVQWWAKKYLPLDKSGKICSSFST